MTIAIIILVGIAIFIIVPILAAVFDTDSQGLD